MDTVWIFYKAGVLLEHESWKASGELDPDPRFSIISNLRHVNLIVDLPSGPRPGNLTCGPQEKKQAQKNKPERQEKNKWALSTELTCLRPEKTNASQKKRNRKGQIPVVA